MGPTILFTYLKIILLQCFRFSVFSNNKFNPNTPYISLDFLLCYKYQLPLWVTIDKLCMYIIGIQQNYEITKITKTANHSHPYNFPQKKRKKKKKSHPLEINIGK